MSSHRSRLSRPRHSRRSLTPAPIGDAPLCQPLEPRLSLSAVVNGAGALVIIGTPQADTIEIETSDGIAGFGVVILRGVPGVADGTQFQGITRINIDLKSGNDTLSLLGLPRRVDGNAADMRVLGGNGHDTIDCSVAGGLLDLRGGNGSDTMTGGVSDDFMKGGKGPDRLFGGMGNDEIHGQRGPDLLVGNHGNDLLLGGDGPDEHWGNQGTDTIRGGKGPDIGWGGQGLDEVFGEAGSDRFNCADEEAMDFVAGDVNFTPQHGTQFGSGLLPISYWNRIAGPEARVSANGRLSDQAASATNIFAEAFRDAAAEYEALSESLEVLGPLGSVARVNLADALQEVTDGFSPPIVANPELISEARFQQLADDLVAACTAPSAVCSFLDVFLTGFVGSGSRFTGIPGSLLDLDERAATLGGFDSVVAISSRLRF